ncbi:MAG: hypothetical protein OEY14_05175 [Myxococcales bacterium]|nr:hypothetical protein [Myxococcales bacterium]
MNALAPREAPGALRRPSLRLAGPAKSLLFLVSIDESIATRIISQLRPEDVRTLRLASEGLEEVDSETIIEIHREFVEIVQGGVPTSLKGSGAYLRRLAGKALGEGRAAEVWEDRERPTGPVHKLAELDDATLLPMLEREHAQTLAVIFSLFDSERAASLIAHFEMERQVEILSRLARLESIPESVIREIESQFALELDALGGIERRQIDGVAATAGLIKRLEGDLSEDLIDELAIVDDALADRVRKALFTFEDLLRVDGRGMQQLLKEISTDQLVVALKTASDELREKVFGNVSSRASATLREELELLGPAKLSDVEAAQAAIVQVAMTLEREGRIQIAHEGGSDYV